MHPQFTPAMVERFWSHVDKSGDCWLWRGTVSSGWYGGLKIDGRFVYAHRFSYELHFGPIPSGMFVCHHCDNPPCVRPDHIFLGTHTDNMRDMAAKGRQGLHLHPERAARGEMHPSVVHPELRRGSRNGRAKLNEGQASEIRRIHGDAVRPDGRRRHGIRTGLARQFGVSVSTIDGILSGRSW